MAEKKGKKRVVQLWKNYEVKGNELSRKNKTCPKCNVFMAKHDNRQYCGKCGYTEFTGKK